MFALYLLVSIKIVSSESGAKPMVKLTSVFYNHHSVHTIHPVQEYFAIESIEDSRKPWMGSIG